MAFPPCNAFGGPYYWHDREDERSFWEAEKEEAARSDLEARSWAELELLAHALHPSEVEDWREASQDVPSKADWVEFILEVSKWT